MKQGVLLLKWYNKNKRSLPWRSKPTPYKIWIAEVMLQQTTVKAVIPYYKKFLKAFPNLLSLASASIEDVIPYWAGLGYYSRVRNLHRSAQLFAERTRGRLPKTYIELEHYPGFGPYTARAVSSQAYGEPVTLMDGNVIRVVCRHNNLPFEWWKKSAQSSITQILDKWRGDLFSGDFNQSLMELGATICSPKSPSCSICPIKSTCLAKRLKITDKLPKKRPRKAKEIWLWKPHIMIKKKAILLTDKHPCPFLKKQWLPPGSIKQLKRIPVKYDLKHSITHHNIYIQISQKPTQKPSSKGSWISLKKVPSLAPTSLINKIFSLKQQEIPVK